MGLSLDVATIPRPINLDGYDVDEKRLTEIIQQSIEAAMRANEYEHRRVNTLLDKIEGTLYGNGHEGLTSIVNRLERMINDAKDIIIKALTALVITSMLGLLILLVQHEILK